MFDRLSDRLLKSIKTLRGQGRITEANIQDTLKEIRLSLLEADVNFQVVKTFIDRVKAKALGQDVSGQITAGQQFVKIVHDELVQILGGGTARIEVTGKPSVLFLVGLQGSGKTTTAAKLALHIRKSLSKKPGLVSVDVYRPAAIEQLRVLAEKNGLPFFTTTESKPEKILEAAKAWAAAENIEAVLLDTAGRLQIDDELMGELSRLKEIWKPDEVLLVADAMLGQQSVNVAEGFHKQVGLTGLVLTKIDGDARGGAALSIRETTGVPIKFLGVGEKSDALEVFHPDRLASRILDMGDVLTLVEKAQEVVDQDQAKATMKKMARNEFTVEDFLGQIQQIKKLGNLESLFKMIPGMGQMMKQVKNMTPPDAELKKIEAIISSMTREERRDHEILNGSRRLRIAKGSGTQVSDVNKFVKQFTEARKMMSQMMKMGLGKRGGMGFPF
ncbi:MAG: signal recognition particle protein [Bdellovibrionia bacterium]